MPAGWHFGFERFGWKFFRLFHLPVRIKQPVVDPLSKTCYSQTD